MNPRPSNIISHKAPKKLSAIFIALLVLLSCLIFATSLFVTKTVKSDYNTAKTMGTKWESFVADFKTNNTIYDFEVNNAQIVKMHVLYNELYPAGSESTFPLGIITPATGGGAAKYQNRTIDASGNVTGQYNYTILIEDPLDLIAFSHLTAGRKYGVTTDSTSDATVAAFFKNANVKLANNINFTGNKNYINSDGSIIRTISTADSNGTYLGYGEGGPSTVFLPIVDFGGVFDGQNFDIANLKILRNGTATFNTSTFDAFFASVKAGGTVKDFGLTKPEFTVIGTVNATNNGYVTGNMTDYAKQVTGTNKNTLAAIVGSNAGSVQYVYSVGALLPSGETVTAFKAVASGTEAIEYSVRPFGTGNAITATKDESSTMTATRWYKSSTDKVQNYFPKGEFYKLSGVKRDGTTSNYFINTAADFVTYMHVLKENQMNKNTAVVSADLNFMYVGEYAIIPSPIGDGGTFTSAAKTTTNANEYFGRYTLYNMRLNAFFIAWDNNNNPVAKNYGLFNSDTFSNTSFIVQNLNFINDNVVIKESKDTPLLSAGILAGRSKRSFMFNSIGVQGNVTAQSGAVLHSNMNLGGIMGYPDNSSGKTDTYSFNFTNVAYMGKVSAGQRVITRGGNISVGGLLGGVNNAFYGGGSYQAVYYENIYINADICGVTALEGTTTNVNNYTGGLFGLGSLALNPGTLLNGIYITGSITNQESSTYNTNRNINVHMGGIVAEMQVQNSSQLSYSDLLFTKTDQRAKVVSAINVNLNTYNKGSATANFNVGGFVGNSNTLTIRGGESEQQFKTSYMFKDDTAALSINFADESIKFGTRNLNVGTLMGSAAGSLKLENIINDIATISPQTENGKTFNLIDGDYNDVRYGGLVGNGNGSRLDCLALNVHNTISARITASVSGSLTASGLISTTANGTESVVNFNGFHVSNSSNSGDIEVLSSTIGNTAVVSGLSTIMQPSSTEATLDENSNSGNLTVSSSSCKAVYINGLAALMPSGTNFTNSGNLSFSGNATGSVYLSGIGYRAKEASGTDVIHAKITNGKNTGNILFSGTTTGAATHLSGLLCEGIAIDSENGERMADGTVKGNITLSGTAVSNSASADDGHVYINGLVETGAVYGGINNGDIVFSGTMNVNAGSSALKISGIIYDGIVNHKENNTAAANPAVNNGHITVNYTISGTNTSLYLGGISAEKKIGGNLIDSINNGNITVQNSSTGFFNSANIGGVVGLFNYSMATSEFVPSVINAHNTGKIEVTGSGSTWTVGGIVGTANHTVYIGGNINSGEVVATNALSTGGIVGSVNGSGSVYDNFNFGNVSLNNTATNANAGVGGIVGNTGSSSTMLVQNNVNGAKNTAIGNLGAVSGTNAATGGIVGLSTSGVTINSSLNYGNISGVNSGGIFGKVSGKVNGAIHYGSVTGGTTTSSGGIGGDSSAATSIENIINYNVLSGSAPLIGSSTTNIVMGIAINNTSQTATVAHPTYGTQSITLNNLFNNFILRPKANDDTAGKTNNEEVYYQTADTTSPTLAWSEKPYKNNGNYHAPYISDTFKYVFALTSTAGRRAGIYLGDNYNIGSLQKVYGLSAEIFDHLTATKQIEYSRDTFVNAYNQQGTIESTTLALLNTTFGNTAHQALPGLTYLKPTQKNPNHRLVSTITYDSPFYLNNMPEGFDGTQEYVVDGSQTALQRESMLDYAFSSGATGDGFQILTGNDGSGKPYTDTAYQFKYNVSESALIASAKVTVYQGTPIKNAEGVYDADWLNMYATEYLVQVKFYFLQPTFITQGNQNLVLQTTEGEKTEQSYYTLTNKDIGKEDVKDDAAVGSTTLPLQANDSNAASVTNYFNDSSNNAQVVKWNYGKLHTTFYAEGFSADFFGTEAAPSGIEWDLLNEDGTNFDSYIHVQRTQIFYSNNIEDEKGEEIAVSLGVIHYTVTLTSRIPVADGANNVIKKELPSGKYRLIFKTTGNDPFTRIFEFDKEQSGDVFMHDASSEGSAQSLALKYNLTDLNAISSNGKQLSYAIDTTFHTINSFTPSGNMYTFNLKTQVDTLPSGQTNRLYLYGFLPNLHDINALGALALYVNKDSSDAATKGVAASEFATVSVPTITLKYTNDTLSKYEILYSYTITAQNGAVGQYNHTLFAKESEGVAQVVQTMQVTTGGVTTNSTQKHFEIAKQDQASIVSNARLNASNINGMSMMISRVAVYHSFMENSFTQDNLVGWVDDKGVFTPTIGLESYFDAQSALSYTIKNHSDHIGILGKTLEVHFNALSLAGYYKFDTYFKYAYSYDYLNADSSKKFANITLQKMDKDGNLITDSVLQLNDYLNADMGNSSNAFTVEKLASKNSYLQFYNVSGNSPSGLTFRSYNPSGAEEDVSVTTGNMDQSEHYDFNYTKTDGSSSIIKPNVSGYYNKRFRALYSFPDAEVGADYTAYITLKVFTSDHYKYLEGGIMPDNGYADEQTRLYTLKKEGENWVKDVELDKTEITLTATDKDGNDITYIDHFFVTFFLPESSNVTVRAESGNPGFYHDYDFLSIGPLRNKVFNFSVSGTGLEENSNFIINMHRTATFTSGSGEKVEYSSHASSIWFNAVKTITDPLFDSSYDAAIDRYYKDYESQFYSAGTYKLSMVTHYYGNELKVQRVYYKTSKTDGTQVDLPVIDNTFTYLSDDPVFIYIECTIQKGAIPPWGDNVFS